MREIVDVVRPLTCRLPGADGGSTSIKGDRTHGLVSAPRELLVERLPAASNAFDRQDV